MIALGGNQEAGRKGDLGYAWNGCSKKSLKRQKGGIGGQCMLTASAVNLNMGEVRFYCWQGLHGFSYTRQSTVACLSREC